MIDSLTVDGLTFAVRWSRRRRTIAITVETDGSLRVAAPVGCRKGALEKMVRERLPWVRRKRAEMAARAAERPARSFADGETLPLLGVEYPLRVVPARGAPATGEGAKRPAPVAFAHGEFVLSPNGADPRALLVAWYTRRGRAHLGARTRHFAAQLQVAPSQVAVRDLGRRWGSCGANGRVRFHWSLMALPAELADYVVVHELAHLRELNHSPRFWALVEGVLPDCRELRKRLRNEGHRYSL